MKKVIVYCVNGYGYRVAYSLNKEQYDVVAFSDSDPETWGHKLYPGGGTVIPPAEINNVEYDHIIIALAEYAQEISKSLVENYAVDAKKILVFQPRLPGFSLEDERIIELRRCIAVQQERNVKGNVAEVGVYRGDFARELNYYYPERKLYLFDTFEGFDTRDGIKDADIHAFKDTSVEYVLSRMPNPQQCIVRKGYFPETAEGIEDRFAFVSLDCDLYKPILAGLKFFYPRLSKGGYIFVHDFGTIHFDGVKKAVYEFCEEYGAAMVPIVDRCSTAIIAK